MYGMELDQAVKRYEEKLQLFEVEQQEETESHLYRTRQERQPRTAFRRISNRSRGEKKVIEYATTKGNCPPTIRSNEARGIVER